MIVTIITLILPYIVPSSQNEILDPPNIPVKEDDTSVESINLIDKILSELNIFRNLH